MFCSDDLDADVGASDRMVTWIAFCGPGLCMGSVCFYDRLHRLIISI